MCSSCIISCFFFFNDTATTEIYTLSLHDALPIFFVCGDRAQAAEFAERAVARSREVGRPDEGARAGIVLGDRKSTRLNSSHVAISYAVFCLKKKKISFLLLIQYNINSYFLT